MKKMGFEPVRAEKISFAVTLRHLMATGLIGLGLALGAYATPAKAADVSGTDLKTGRETGLPLPRFVSLKAESVNLRVGPGRKYAISWQYRMRGLPVEVIQEFEQWRRIRDADGATGWVLHSLLSSKRTAVVAPWEKAKVEIGKPVKIAFFDGKKAARADAGTVARLQPGLLVNVDECAGNWCSVEVQNTRFWLQQESLWGVYPNEAVDG